MKRDVSTRQQAEHEGERAFECGISRWSGNPYSDSYGADYDERRAHHAWEDGHYRAERRAEERAEEERQRQEAERDATERAALARAEEEAYCEEREAQEEQESE